MMDIHDTPLPTTIGTIGTAISMRSIMNRVRAVHAQHIFPEINNPTAEQRAAMQYEIECDGLTVHDLGEAFADDFQGRRLWCREHCEGTFFVEPIWDAAARCDTGRRFLFSEKTDAVMFRIKCC